MEIMGNHGEIISKEDFEKVQQVLKEKTKMGVRINTAIKKSEQRQKESVPPGYKIMDGKLVINEAEADVIKEQINNIA